jgi:hypothetical protein
VRYSHLLLPSHTATTACAVTRTEGTQEVQATRDILTMNAIATLMTSHTLKGRKRFLLFPPNTHSQLDLHSALHPAHRSAQVQLVNLDDSTTQTTGSGGEGSGCNQAAVVLPAIEVVLEPGEILFVPALWYRACYISQHHGARRCYRRTASTFSPFSNAWQSSWLATDVLPTSNVLSVSMVWLDVAINLLTALPNSVLDSPLCHRCAQVPPG